MYNNIDLYQRENVFEHVNRNIQYIWINKCTCTEYFKSKTRSKQVYTGLVFFLDLLDKPVGLVDKLNY